MIDKGGDPDTAGVPTLGDLFRSTAREMFTYIAVECPKEHHHRLKMVNDDSWFEPEWIYEMCTMLHPIWLNDEARVVLILKDKCGVEHGDFTEEQDQYVRGYVKHLMHIYQTAQEEEKEENEAH